MRVPPPGWITSRVIGRHPPQGNHTDAETYRPSRWVSKTRRRYRKKLAGGNAGPLTDERIERLSFWFFDWNRKLTFASPPIPSKPWEERYNELLAYKEKHGDVDVPQQYPVLGNWVHHQRKHYRLLKGGKKTTLTKEKVEKLVSVGFKWITRKSPGSRRIDTRVLHEAGTLDFAKYEQHQPEGVVAAPQTAAAITMKIDKREEASSSSSEEEDDDDSSDTPVLPTNSPEGRGSSRYSNSPWDKYRCNLGQLVNMSFFDVIRA